MDLSELVPSSMTSRIRGVCRIPSCSRREDRRYPTGVGGYFCTEHGQEVFRREEHKKVIPLEAAWR